MDLMEMVQKARNDDELAWALVQLCTVWIKGECPHKCDVCQAEIKRRLKE